MPLHHITPAAHAILGLLRQHDFIALSLLIFLQEMGIPLPLPGNLLLAFLGMQSNRGNPNIVQLIFVMSCASIAGSITLYTLGDRIGHPLLLRWGKWFGLEEGRVALIERWLARYGAPVVFIGRILPGFRTPTSAVSGIFNISMIIFAIATSIAAFVWTIFWVVAGRILGHSFHLQRFLNGNHTLTTMLIGLAFLVFLPLSGFLLTRWQRYKQKHTIARGTSETPSDIREDQKHPALSSSPTDHR